MLNPFNTKEFLSLQPMFPPKPFDNFSPEGRCSEGLDAFRFFFIQSYLENKMYDFNPLFPLAARTIVLMIIIILI